MSIYCVWGWVLVAQLRPTLCEPMDCSPPGPSVQRIPQARKLGWVAIPFSRGSCRPRDWIHVSWLHLLHWQVDSFPLSHLGSPRRDDTETEFENISRITSFEIGRNGEEVILSKKKNTKKSWNRRSSQETQPQCHENWEAVEADK